MLETRSSRIVIARVSTYMEESTCIDCCPQGGVSSQGSGDSNPDATIGNGSTTLRLDSQVPDYKTYDDGMAAQWIRDG